MPSALSSLYNSEIGEDNLFFDVLFIFTGKIGELNFRWVDIKDYKVKSRFASETFDV